MTMVSPALGLNSQHSPPSTCSDPGQARILCSSCPIWPARLILSSGVTRCKDSSLIPRYAAVTAYRTLTTLAAHDGTLVTYPVLPVACSAIAPKSVQARALPAEVVAHTHDSPFTACGANRFQRRRAGSEKRPGAVCYDPSTSLR